MMGGITLIVSIFPRGTMKTLVGIGGVECSSMAHLTGRFSDGRMFKIVSPYDVPTLFSLGLSSNILVGVKLNEVQVLPPAVLSQRQREWLLSRRRVTVPGIFIR